MSTIDRREEKIAEALAAGHEIVHADEKTITLDFDDVEECPDLEEKLAILHEYLSTRSVEKWRSKSGTGWHVVIKLYDPLPFHQRIAIQAAMGSDWKRELLYARLPFGHEPFLIRPGLQRTVELIRENKHQCREADFCLCSTSALEPNDNCPKHGHPWPPRCKDCGKFLKRKIDEWQ